MLTTVNFLYGNVFYIVRRCKLAWLLLVQPSAFFRNQDGDLRHLEFRPIFNIWSRWHTCRGSCNTSFMGVSRMGSPFLELFFGYGSTWRLNQRLKVKVYPKSHKITYIHWLYVVCCIPIPPYMQIPIYICIYQYIKEIKRMWTWIYVSGIPICKYLLQVNKVYIYSSSTSSSPSSSSISICLHLDYIRFSSLALAVVRAWTACTVAAAVCATTWLSLCSEYI